MVLYFLCYETRGCSSMVEHQPSKLDTWVRFPSPAFLLPKNSRDGILCMEPVNTVDWRVKDQCVYLCIADCNGCPVSADIERKTDCEIGDRCSTDSYRTGYFTEEK